MITFDVETSLDDGKIQGYINIPEKLYSFAYHTGSSAICNPPVTNTDIDFIIYTESISNLDEYLECIGATASCTDGDEYELGMDFWCYRKNEVNLIVTNRLDFYDRFVAATRLAKELNLVNKEDRITLFRYVLYKERACLPLTRRQLNHGLSL